MSLTVVQPTAKAMKSVTEVTVMATPACFIVCATRSMAVSGIGSKLSNVLTITNISSTPTPMKYESHKISLCYRNIKHERCKILNLYITVK